ncbi:hypothetical protein Sango_1265100 [Sesamum angolense]|uniref:Uncharacterized protein n=1 Tax=Sesamum angolense TaxID=2727404 RepID=A0AAE2BU65_9LAMI|nr:hypothetical protein Sango_1265100 [Sesamum angolense]
MALVELAELRKQLDGLLEAGLIQRSKAPYGSLIFCSKGNKMKLREYELCAKKEKCEFYCEQITFLGHVISQGKIQMDCEKAIHFGVFENGESLDEFAKERSEVEWTVACDDAFRLLKQAISSQPVLKLPQFDQPFKVQVDASDSALGGVLVQDKHPVAFESYKVKDAELRYSTHKKEMTVVVHCLDAWKHFLLVSSLISLIRFEKVPRRMRVILSWWNRSRGPDPKAGHPGIDKMLALLAGQYYWPKMEEDAEAYEPWQSVSMDFILGFPKVNDMASVLVVVDRFSKYGIFIATPHACPAETTAELFFKNVTKYFGFPKTLLVIGMPDMGRRHVEFSVGDQVLLKLTPQIWKKISSKSVHRGLIPKYDGPFEVVSKVGSLAYRLKLLDRLKIHPTFHVSFLKKFHQDLLDTARQQTRRAPPVI